MSPISIGKQFPAVQPLKPRGAILAKRSGGFVAREPRNSLGLAFPAGAEGALKLEAQADPPLVENLQLEPSAERISF